MDRSRDEPTHKAAVDAWLERSIDHGSTVEIVRLFHAAFEGVWSRAVTTLGSITLTAIAERVLLTATDRYEFLSAINPRPNGDTRWKQHLHERLAVVPRAELIEGLRFGLIELLTIVGRLTAEILSQELHTALIEVASNTHDSKTSTDSRAVPAAVRAKEST
jgi:hypothetical protein